MKKNGYFSIKKPLPSWFSLHHQPIPLKSYLFMCHLNIQHWSLCLCDSHWIAKPNKDVHHLGFIFSFVWHFFLISLKNKFGMWQWDGGWAYDIVIISGPVPTWPNSFSSWKYTHTHTHTHTRTHTHTHTRGQRKAKSSFVISWVLGPLHLWEPWRAGQNLWCILLPALK